jgi:hypothetical protein
MYKLNLCVKYNELLQASTIKRRCKWKQRRNNKMATLRCSYRLSGQQCPLASEISTAHKTSYCSDHYYCIKENDRTTAEIILRNAHEGLRHFLI